VWPNHRADNVVCRVRRAHPIAHGRVGRVFERLSAALDGDDVGPEQLHAENVRALAPHVLRAHVDVAPQAEFGRGRGRGDPVLPGAGFGNDPVLAHAVCQKGLAERIVDLVRPGVGQILALEVNLRPAQALGQPPGVFQGRRPADVVAQKLVQLTPERLVALGSVVLLGQLRHRCVQRLGDISSAELAEVTFIRLGLGGGGRRCDTFVHNEHSTGSARAGANGAKRRQRRVIARR